MHVIGVLGLVALVILGLWALTHLAGLWTVLTISIGLGGSPGVAVNPNKGFTVQVPPVSAPAVPVTPAPASAPAVSAEAKQILAAISALDLKQQERDVRQDGRLDSIESRLDGLAASRPSHDHEPDCNHGGRASRFGPAQTVSPR